MAEETATEASNWVAGAMSALDEVEGSLAELASANTGASSRERSRSRRGRARPDEVWWQEQAATLMQLHTKLELLQRDMARIGSRVEVLCQELLTVNRILREGISNLNAGEDSDSV